MPAESSHSRAISRFKLFGDITMVISPALLTQSVTSSRRPPNALDTLHQTASPCLRLLHGAPQQKAVLGRVGRCNPSHRCRSLKEAELRRCVRGLQAAAARRPRCGAPRCCTSATPAPEKAASFAAVCSQSTLARAESVVVRMCRDVLSGLWAPGLGPCTLSCYFHCSHPLLEPPLVVHVAAACCRW